MDSSSEENNKYHNSKIYYLMDDINNKIFYIGSTIGTLDKRLYYHNYDAKNTSRSGYDGEKNEYIRSIISQGGTISIHLIENYSCNNKKDLLYRERYHMQRFYPLYNVNRPIISEEEYKKYRKTYSGEKNICKCGSTYTNSHKSDHEKTIRHIDYIMNQVD